MRSAAEIMETPPAMVPFSGSSMLVVFEVTEMATGYAQRIDDWQMEASENGDL
jgi:hypothetical protein